MAGVDLEKLRERLRNRAALYCARRTVRAVSPFPVVSFSFDDFPRSAYDVGGRLLEAAGARATYFVAGSYAGKTIDGIEQYGEDTLKAAGAAGHEIACHTYDHQKLGARGAAAARESCTKNARLVERLLGIGMTSFAYPYGDASPAVKAAVSGLYPVCRGVRRHLNAGRMDFAQLGIVSLESRHAGETDIEKTAAEIVAQKAWAIFLCHDVSDTPSPYGTTPAVLEKTLRALRAAQIPVMTVRAAAEKIQGKER